MYGRNTHIGEGIIETLNQQSDRGGGEVTSNTNLTEFQSRRLNIRYKDGDERGFVHTISATAATDRMLICILETYQQPDGSIIIPEVLRPYTGFDRIEAPAK